ncbi:SNF2-related protein [Venturia nashicola]|uniref:DNA helicase n=1 Tax=Venturia nashicola TaxID=86259 RepID=A0A4Z1PKY1_9PEZI|nr:SNF2-related protein [Venturia nashicola]TLD38598.1 SNF2-related protein [Venturia nashicola]
MSEGDLGANNHGIDTPVPNSPVQDTALPTLVNGDHANETNGHSTEPGDLQSGSDEHVIPQPKKRKLDSISKSGRSSRAPSPPWKLPTAAGPSATIVDGRRQSSRKVTTSSAPTSEKEDSKTRSEANKPESTERRTTRPYSESKPRLSYGALHNGRMETFSKEQKSTPHKSFKKPRRPSAKENPVSFNRGRSQSGAPTESSDQSETPLPSKSKNRNRRRSSQVKETVEATPKANGQPSRSSQNGDTPNTASRFQKLKLFVRDSPQNSRKYPPMLSLPILHPKARPPDKQFVSFDEWLKQDDPLEDEPEARVSKQVAQREAQARLRLSKAAEPGGIFSEENRVRFQIDDWKEPEPRYGHWSHVVAHAENFHKLLVAESIKHRRTAKKAAVDCRFAIYAEDRWEFLRESKSIEQIWKEEEGYQIKRYMQVVKDVEARWKLAMEEFTRIKIQEGERVTEKQGQKALDDMLDQSTQILNQNRPRSESDTRSIDRSSVDLAGSDAGTNPSDPEDGQPEDDDENMSDSSDDEDNIEAQDEDANLSPDALKQKYASVLQQQREESDASEEESEGEDEASDMEVEQLDEVESRTTALLGHSVDSQGPQPNSKGNGEEIDHKTNTEVEMAATSESAPPQLDEVDDILMDGSSDASTNMDDDMGSSDDDSGSEGMEDDDDDDDEEDEAGSGLMGFLAPREREKIAPEASSPPDAELKDTPTTNGQNGHLGAPEEEEADEELPRDDLDNVIASKVNGHHESPPQKNRPRSISMGDTTETTTTRLSSDSATPQTPKSPSKVDVPSLLLRGTLREYQHNGLDWLANLYLGDRNGILADEMGLGKTIQTIALLAHLAIRYGVWGPHLVVVPSSVMLNWEIEFKKWLPGFKILTYYGDQDERRRKREGWLNDDKWNVCITSYQLILKDQQAFKRRSWHYLILDEAHNIKNFQSQRWQVLLTFKTHSRLLLTGTPLQNNLQELWSLLYFLMPAGLDGAGGFADLEKFLNSMKRPADQILDQGMQKLDAEAQARVTKLHEVLRPFLLRRLKADVEKQMPGKYEHVVYCRLSKRQRQLYDEFMGRTETKRTLTSGNYMSIINCLMSLRKVCNHPDLFETRQIVTSFAMPKSVVADYASTERLIRRRLLTGDQIDLAYCGLCMAAFEPFGRCHHQRRRRLNAIKTFKDLASRQIQRLNVNTEKLGTTMSDALAHVTDAAEISILDQLKSCIKHAQRQDESFPVYGTDFINFLTLPNPFTPRRPGRKKQLWYSMGEWYLDTNTRIPELMPSLYQVAERDESLIRTFGCITPAVVAEDVLPLALTPRGVEVVKEAQKLAPRDPFHEARIKLSIAFPDKRLLQYDCGKLQRLDTLLRQLQAGGHRCLIFTQMTKVLDILEQFLNIHGHRYLRLDGSTKIEQRQLLTDQFNNDTRILAFILSSRSGGLGINLTGADTVIFYDLDWNPAMDAQCQDRAHRIGQTRDVHIYRFVSEYTIEANILRKSNQKRLLDDVIIQKGEFTSDKFNRVTYKDAFDDPTELNGEDAEASAAMDRVLGEVTGLGKVLEQVEDKEDTMAAKAAQKEIIHEDAEDFNESTNANTPKDAATTPGTDVAQQAMEMEGEDALYKNVDEYMMRFYLEYEMAHITYYLPPKPSRRNAKKARSYRAR